MIMTVNTANLNRWKNTVHYQLPVSKLVEQCLQRQEGVLNDTGALVIQTGQFTGRSPDDKYIVTDTITRNTVDWNKFNRPISEDFFFALRDAMLAYLDKKTEVWIRDAFVCAELSSRISLRIINENPSSNHFAANMFIPPGRQELEAFTPAWLIVQAPGFRAQPGVHGTQRQNFTIISFQHKTVLIGGSGYTGEIKKSVFTMLNFLLPREKNVLSMHCSANIGRTGDTALFFGLSGTGKTTLSADPERALIGDDEHGWNDEGIFNFEGGCYAKVIDLSETGEPDIYRAVRPGALVENTTFFPGSTTIDFTSRAITENTRVSYPLNFITNTIQNTQTGPPKNIFFLTCDAYGVLPPVSKLTAEQAMYYFLCGYTARVAGTENGIREPQITFSACFGAPFLPLASDYYADLFRKKIDLHGSRVWMINTGWTGGPYGTGTRISLKHTRAIIRAILNDELVKVKFKSHEIFGLYIPECCPGVPATILSPEDTWNESAAYKTAAKILACKFEETIVQKRI